MYLERLLGSVEYVLREEVKVFFQFFFHCQSKLWKQTFPILELRLIEYHCGDSCRISFNGMASCMANLLRFDKN